MAHVRFVHDFDYSPTEQSTIGYLAGMEETVRRECADQAIAAGKAVEILPLKKEPPNGQTPIGG